MNINCLVLSLQYPALFMQHISICCALITLSFGTFCDAVKEAPALASRQCISRMETTAYLSLTYFTEIGNKGRFLGREVKN